MLGSRERLRRCDAGVFRFQGATGQFSSGYRCPDCRFGDFFLLIAGIYFALKRYTDVPIAVPGYESIAKMSKILFVIPLVLMASSASAQQRVGQDACSRDVSRFCRAQMQDGDQIILACLKQNRAKISKGCQQMLASHGQ
jgi:hypothetical protein